MKTIRNSPFMNPLFSLIMALAAFLGIASFLKLNDKNGSEHSHPASMQKNIFPYSFLGRFFRQARFAVIMLFFILLFLNEEED